jgi:hypothetical protein
MDGQGRPAFLADEAHPHFIAHWDRGTGVEDWHVSSFEMGDELTREVGFDRLVVGPIGPPHADFE